MKQIIIQNMRKRRKERHAELRQTPEMAWITGFRLQDSLLRLLISHITPSLMKRIDRSIKDLATLISKKTQVRYYSAQIVGENSMSRHLQNIRKYVKRCSCRNEKSLTAQLHEQMELLTKGR